MEIEKQSEIIKRKWKKELVSWIKTFVVVLILVIVIRGFLFTNYIVYGQSMMPTIHDKERIIINKIGYDLSPPKRFDMIVFHASETTDYIKRVIGLPGDAIEFKDDVLYINGEAIEEPFLTETITYKGQPFTDNFSLEELTGETVVPKNHLFVLGDNRRNSIDSRQIGFVPIDKIVGKADIAYWPIKHLRKLK